MPSRQVEDEAQKIVDAPIWGPPMATEFTCDGPGCETPPVIVKPFPGPEGWFTVYPGGVFCSAGCLAKWAVMEDVKAHDGS